MKELDLKRRINVRETSDSSPIMRQFSLYILYYLSTYHMVYALYDQASKNPSQFAKTLLVLATGLG